MAEQEKTAAERTEEIISQCVVWCAAKRLEPIPISEGFERSWLLMAVHDYKKDFQSLNQRQRQLFASMSK